MVDFSVIIPHYNNLELLPKAINSIPVDVNCEVIVVDNSPTPIQKDDIKNVTRDFELTYSSCKKGAGAARNVALEKATGKFLLFLDADDYFTSDAFETFASYVDSDYEIIYFNATSINLLTGKTGSRHYTISDKIDRYVNEEDTDILRYSFINPVCKMISRKLVVERSIKFQEVPASNDLMFSTWTGHYANKIHAVDKVVYVITEGESGTSLTKTKSLRNQESRFKVIVDQSLFLKEIGRPDLCARLISFLFHGFIDFGPITGFRWIMYALKKGVNPFKF